MYNPSADLLLAIRGDYLEVPNLRLTRSQVEQLWGIDPATAQASLDALIARRFLTKTSLDGYVRLNYSAEKRSQRAA